LGNLKNSTEKKLLAAFIIICLVLPFGFSRSPEEIISHAIPLFIWLHGTVGYWLFSGKPVWQTSLACYGISTVLSLGVYFGTFGISLAAEKAVNWLKKQLKRGVKIPFSKDQILVLKKRTGYQILNSFAEARKQKIAKQMEKKSNWILLLFFFVPVLDIVAVAVLGARRLKYGHWYLALANLPRIFLIVYLLSLGIDFGINLFS